MLFLKTNRCVLLKSCLHLNVLNVLRDLMPILWLCFWRWTHTDSPAHPHKCSWHTRDGTWCDGWQCLAYQRIINMQLCAIHTGGDEVCCPWEELLVETGRRSVSLRRFGGVQPGTALKCCCRQPWDGTFSFQLLMALWMYEDTKFTQPTSYFSPMLWIKSSLPTFLYVVWHVMEHMLRILCNEHNFMLFQWYVY